MIHRFLLCAFLLGLTAAAQSEQLLYDSKGDSWTWASGGGDEGGGGSSYLGVDIADVSTERLAALKLKEEDGAEVTMVDQDAPAGKAGLHEHDVILNLNGTPVESAAQLRRMIKETPPGRVINLGISRDGQAMTIKVQLADRHKSMNWAPEVHVEIPRIPPIPNLPDFDVPVSVVMVHSSARSGLMVENITQQLGDFFGVKDGKGVLVRSVEKGSRGEKSGFRAGDVIVKVNSEPVHDSSDFTHALRSSSGSSAAVTVMREKREQTLTLSLPEKDSGAVIEESLGDSDWTAETVEAVNRAGDEMAAIAPVMSEVIAETDCWKEAQEKVKEAQQELEEKQQELQQEEQEREQELQEQQKEQQEQEKDMQEHRLQRQQEIEQEQQERQQEIIEQQKELQEQQLELQERVREGLAKQLADL